MNVLFEFPVIEKPSYLDMIGKGKGISETFAKIANQLSYMAMEKAIELDLKEFPTKNFESFKHSWYNWKHNHQDNLKFHMMMHYDKFKDKLIFWKRHKTT
jgi:hypothetical protein